MQGFRQGAAMAAVRVVRRLREAGDWQREMVGILETLCRAIECQRGILFRLRELPGQGFAQSVAAYWIDPDFGGELASPTVIVQSIVNSDPLLERVAEDERQGKIFAGHTRNLEGFLRTDFEKQNIKSFLSVSVFAHAAQTLLAPEWPGIAHEDLDHRAAFPDAKRLRESRRQGRREIELRGRRRRQRDQQLARFHRTFARDDTNALRPMLDARGRFAEPHPVAEITRNILGKRLHGQAQHRRRLAGAALW